MNLRYATVTGVARDDLPDEGVWLYAETIRQIHSMNPGTGVEILIPDFSGRPEHIAAICDAAPEVFAHNVETVPRIFKRIRPAFRYERSLDVISQGRARGMVTKSNLILGMGETREEISEALRDLHSAGCDLITITQYLRPSERHLRWTAGSSPASSSSCGGGRGDRLPRGDERAAGAVLLPAGRCGRGQCAARDSSFRRSLPTSRIRAPPSGGLQPESRLRPVGTQSTPRHPAAGAP
jgi:hypothetical protein